MLAAFFAGLCVFWSLVGALITLAAGLIALMLVSRSGPSRKSEFSEYFPWLLCTVSFVVTTLLLSPFAELSGVTIALCLLSPLFGTMIYIVERAVSHRTGHSGSAESPST
ncbi:MAG: hypothetical protein DWQ34_03070 [Planctomycetota bacterium]|nr:MAG: hypothetical protein DWQ34_03070 [Planctomycetota bacterium]REK21497.1 MAG: hypothetical protein DWQ41_21300 [Planctomycetota bacterium]REK34334.1 MAG: hypothetical protein DWQ45_13740 [Planctomycetota bacterium]